MAAICVLHSLHPCPICLIKNEDLSDLSKTADKHTTAVMKKIYKDAKKLTSKDAQEDMLKVYGMRDVEVRTQICFPVSH